MRKKMKLPFLFKTVAVESSWPWPSCNQPRTLSFRAADMFKTMNSAYLDGPSETQTPESWFSRSSDDPTEAVIRGAKSERLFFEPGETNSILEEVKVGEQAPLKESLVVLLESRDPYGDFRESMAEMVEAHGLRGWDKLEELLGWYLRVNSEQNHEYIVGAFIDLLASPSPSPSPVPHKCICASSSCPISKNLRPCHQDSPSSPLSFYTSFSSSSSTTPCASSSLDHDDDVKEIQEIEEEEEDPNPYRPPG